MAYVSIMFDLNEQMYELLKMSKHKWKHLKTYLSNSQNNL